MVWPTARIPHLYAQSATRRSRRPGRQTRERSHRGLGSRSVQHQRHRAGLTAVPSSIVETTGDSATLAAEAYAAPAETHCSARAQTASIPRSAACSPCPALRGAAGCAPRRAGGAPDDRYHVAVGRDPAGQDDHKQRNRRLNPFTLCQLKSRALPRSPPQTASRFTMRAAVQLPGPPEIHALDIEEERQVARSVTARPIGRCPENARSNHQSVTVEKSVARRRAFTHHAAGVWVDAAMRCAGPNGYRHAASARAVTVVNVVRGSAHTFAMSASIDRRRRWRGGATLWWRVSAQATIWRS